MHDGRSIKHIDASAPNRGPDDGTYIAPTAYAPFPEKDGTDSDGRKYGPIERRGIDITISSPVDDIETLFLRTHLTAQFHAENCDFWQDISEYDNNGGTLYDEVVLNLYEEKLELEGIDPADLDIPERRLKTLFLRLARGQLGTNIHEYLSGPDPVDPIIYTLLGYEGPDDIPSYDTLQREFRELTESDEVDMDALEAAVTRTVYAVYRAGVVPPDAIIDKYNFDAVAPPLDEKSVSRETKKEELRNWVRLLIDHTTDPLTFDRSPEKADHDMRAFLGALATSALFGCGLENMKDFSDWDYPRENIPSGGWLHNYVPDISADSDLRHFAPESSSAPCPSIDEQFGAVHTRTLALAKKLGFWSRSDSLNIGADMFRIDWTGDSFETTIRRPAKADNDAVTQQWTFLLAGSIDTDSRFVLGGRLVATKSDCPTALNEILSNTFDTVDINSIFMDSEMASGEFIDTARRFVGDDWVISAPDHTMIKGLRRLTPSNCIGFAEGVSWNTEPKPNVVTYPYGSDDPDLVEINPEKVLREEIQHEEDEEEIRVPLATGGETDTRVQSPLASDDSIPMLTEAFSDVAAQDGVGENHTHAAYLTDRSLRDRSGAGVRYQYVQRWAIESTIGQIVNDFMPRIESGDPKQRLYGVHIAIMFYNWHTMINRCLSPRGLRLDVTDTEVLQAIRDVAFDPVDYDAFW